MKQSEIWMGVPKKYQREGFSDNTLVTEDEFYALGECWSLIALDVATRMYGNEWLAAEPGGLA